MNPTLFALVRILVFALVITQFCCGSKKDLEYGIYVDNQAKIKCSYSNRYTLKNEDNRIILVDTCTNCIFKPNIVISIYNDFDSSKLEAAARSIEMEVCSLSKNVNLRKDSVVKANLYQLNFMYRFNRDKLALVGFTQMEYFSKERSLIAVNSLMERDQLAERKMELQKIFESVKPIDN